MTKTPLQVEIFLYKYGPRCNLEA